MKVFIIVLVAALAAVTGYLMGTESGRQQRDDLIAKVRKQSKKATDVVEDTVAEATEQLSA